MADLAPASGLPVERTSRIGSNTIPTPQQEWRSPPEVRYSGLSRQQFTQGREVFLGMGTTSQRQRISGERPRILVLTRYTRQGASSRVRFLQFLAAMQDRFQFDISPFFDEGYIDALYSGSGVSRSRVLACYFRRLRVLLRRRTYDLIWLEKEALPWIPYWLERWFVRDTPYVVDLDDAWFHRYDMHPSRLVRAVLTGKIDSVMRSASVVVAGNEYLARHAQVAGAARVSVIPSAIDLDRYPPAASLAPARKGPDATTVIGWIGTPVTAPYLGLIAPAVRVLAREMPIELRLIGAPVPRELRDVPATSRPWIESGEVEEILNLDIGIMPLEDTAWEQGKCAYKLLQIMAAGRPVVGSRVGANSTVVENGVNGFLASTSEEWLRALRSLASDTELRRRLGAAARQTVERDYSRSRVLAPLAESLQLGLDEIRPGAGARVSLAGQSRS